MAAKIITFFLILVINLAIGVGIGFFLMLGLNGFSERDGNYAFLTYIAGGLLVTLLTAAAGFFLVGLLLKKEWNQILAVLLSVVGFALLGLAAKFVLFFIALFVADFVRTSR